MNHHIATHFTELLKNILAYLDGQPQGTLRRTQAPLVKQNPLPTVMLKYTGTRSAVSLYPAATGQLAMLKKLNFLVPSLAKHSKPQAQKNASFKDLHLS